MSATAAKRFWFYRECSPTNPATTDRASGCETRMDFVTRWRAGTAAPIGLNVDIWHPAREVVAPTSALDVRGGGSRSPLTALGPALQLQPNVRIRIRADILAVQVDIVARIDRVLPALLGRRLRHGLRSEGGAQHGRRNEHPGVHDTSPGR